MKSPAPALLSGLLIGALALVGVSACTNGLSKKAASKSIPLGQAVTAASNSLVIASVSIPNPSATASPTPADASATEATISFDLSQSSSIISDYCLGASSNSGSSSTTTNTKACLCQYYWLEVNSSGGTSVNVRRLEHTTVTAVQNGAVACAAPSEYARISDATDIQVTVIPATTNASKFTIPSYTFTKNKAAAGATGAFKDALGRTFVNVLRYSCHEQVLRGMSISSKLNRLTNTFGQPEYIDSPSATILCVQKSSDTTPAEGCPGGTLDYSAQAYYYNLYVRESEIGDINEGNGRYTCPKVKEALRRVPGSVGTENKYWPLDATFALSLGKTSDFSVGVVANTKTSNPNDPVSVASSCDSTAKTSVSGNTLLTGCLGWAAKPNVQGVCPTLLKDDGVTPMPTYRLRRYFTIYPHAFDTDGSPIKEAQALDSIYVLDRPVAGPSGAEYTMTGPKPCPFAFFDHKGVTGSKQYLGTNNAAWNNKSVDGIRLPNVDSANSCAMALPILNSSRTRMSYTTIHSTNTDARYRDVHVRPTKPWSPHYIEDTSFQACAPLANPFQDAPLHMETNGAGDTAWCAEAYPSQNANLTALDPDNLGTILPFTSHSHTSCNFSADVNGTISGKHGAPYDKTCDRTVLVPPSGMNWGKFPLLAPAPDVESALASDDSFACAVTYDAGGAKSSGKHSPAGGCCKSVVLGAGGEKHILPGTDCTKPTY